MCVVSNDILQVIECSSLICWWIKYFSEWIFEFYFMNCLIDNNFG